MVSATASHYLAINAGSSSIKFALYRAEPGLRLILQGSIKGIGGTHASFCARGENGEPAADTMARHFAIPERVTAVHVLLDWLSERIAPDALRAIAHRVVHGSAHDEGARAITPALLGELHAALRDEPEHLPQEVHLIEALQRRFPQASHIACSDSHFHARMPAAASMLAIPHRFTSTGLRRYGYHGLSCSWMVRELARCDGDAAAQGKLVLAHLGGGSSITAVEGGMGRDTSMGLTPAGGIVMGKRSGDIDPGLAWHCTRQEAMTQVQFHHMLTHESGLLGVSGRSADLRVLLDHESTDSRCASAVELFVYQTRKAICAMAGAISGIDTLVFTGGIGENSAAVRARICTPLVHLGIILDPDRNSAGQGVISAVGSRVKVRVIASNEEWMLAEQARLLLSNASVPPGMPQ